MSKEILLMVDVVSNEKGVDKGLIFEAMEAALASATQKRSREDIEARVAIDRDDGSYETFRRWEVLEDGAEIEFPTRQISHTEALAQQPDIAVGDYTEAPMQSVKFGRIAAQAARQVIVQKVREAERSQMVALYQNRIGEMVSGVVKSVERSGVFLDLGNNAEGFIPRDKLIQKESFRTGDRRRAYLQEIRTDSKGAQILLSRTANELLVELFKLEVPEINEGMIDIISGARDACGRAKIAVRANGPRIDPIGACVGMRGSRVQAVSNELFGERVDIILWDEDPAQFVINAMAPAEVDSIMVDEDNKSMDIVVTEDSLSQAIGRGGQNVRLASELTGWNLNVMSVTQAEEKIEVEAEKLQAMFMEQLDVDEEIAVILVQEGFSSVEEIAYVPEKELAAIEEFDDALVNELRERSRDLMLTRAIVSEEQMTDIKPADDLLAMDDVDEALAYTLAGHGIVSMDDLAEQSVEELLALIDLDAQRAGQLIMAARQPWFAASSDTDNNEAN